MGCLTLTVEDLSGNGVAVAALGPPKMEVTCELVSAQLDVAAANCNSPLNVEISMVCNVDIDKWRTLNVVEGPLIVQEGYLIVLRDGRLRS